MECTAEIVYGSDTLLPLDLAALWSVPEIKLQERLAFPPGFLPRTCMMKTAFLPSRAKQSLHPA